MKESPNDELAARALKALTGQQSTKQPRVNKEEVEAKKLLVKTAPTGSPTKMAVLEQNRPIYRRGSQNDQARRQKTHQRLVNRTLGEEIHEFRTSGTNWKQILAILRSEHPELRNIQQIQDIYFNYLDISRQNRRENIEEMREMQHDRLEAAWAGLSNKIDMGRERAVEVGIKVLERQARLWGLDASDQVLNKQTNQQINIMIQAHPGDDRAKHLLIEHQPLALEEHKE